MVNFYVKRIKANKMLWTDVPSKWFEDVKDALESEGYILNDDGTISLPDLNEVADGE